MAAIAEIPSAIDAVRRTGLALWLRLRSLLAWARQFFAPAAEEAEEPVLTFPARVRKFLWLSSGLFSAASFMLPAIGFLVFGSVEDIAADFLVAVVSACLFGFASLLHFGPETA